MNNVNQDERTKKILYYDDKGYSADQIASILGVNRSTVYRHLRKNKKDVPSVQQENSNNKDSSASSDAVELHVRATDSSQQYAYSYVAYNDHGVILRTNMDTGETDFSSVREEDLINLKNIDLNSITRSLSNIFDKRFYGGREPIVEGNVTADFRAGSVTYRSDDIEFSLPDSLVGDILYKTDNSSDATRKLMAFANRLGKNPSHRVFSGLYDYLLGNGIEITENGMIHCYKRVRENYFDIHSGTFDNHPGNTVSMPRVMVDENKENACSTGLHVCSSDYLPTFANGRGDRIILVEVDPADVVSIPYDNSAKCRCCKYLVLADVSNEFDFVD